MVGLERGTVELREHRREWHREYEREVDRLESLAGEEFLGYEHVGSTAVEGLAAKPVIDLLALVEDLEAARGVIGDLEGAGYEHRPGEVEGRIFLAKGPRTERTHYLSITERGSDFHVETVAFRDYLRDHPEVAREYERLKRELAGEYADDRDAYTEAKDEFVTSTTERAIASGYGPE